MQRDETQAREGLENLKRLRELIAEAQRPPIPLRVRALMAQLKASLRRTGVVQ